MPRLPRLFRISYREGMFPVGILELTIVAAFAGFAFLLGFYFGHFTDWPRRRVLLVSAVAVPAAIAMLCVYLFVDAATASREECGVDACGMAMGAAVTVLVLDALALLLSLVFALLGLKLARR